MKQVLQNFKKPLRHSLKYVKALAKGYPFHYASQQSPADADYYLYKWIEFSTPIPDRGISEIRANRIWNLQMAE